MVVRYSVLGRWRHPRFLLTKSLVAQATAIESANSNGGPDIDDTYFSKNDRYSLGIEASSGRHYLSIPVSNGALDYEEFYELTFDQYATFLGGGRVAIEFAESCRRHERDHLLIEKPRWNRGTPV